MIDGGAQISGAGLVGQDAAGMQAQIDEELFQVIDVSNPEKSRQVPLEHFAAVIFTTNLSAILGSSFWIFL